MTATRPPRARPAAVPLALLLALLLVAVAVVAVRDLAVDQAWTAGTSWSSWLLEAVDGLRATTAVTAVGVAVAVVGLLLVLLALKPARRTHLPARLPDRDPGVGGAALWLSPAALTALAENVADRAPGVVSARARRGRRDRVEVTVVTSQEASVVEERVRAAVEDRLGRLTSTTVTVRVEEVAR